MAKKNKHNPKKNPEYIITPTGSLGLLAYGDIGLRAWRKEKEAISKNEPNA